MNSRIRLFDKYLFFQVFWATFICILLFMIVWIAPETLFNTIRDTMKGIFTVNVAIKIIINKLPEVLSRALPVGLLLGCLYSFDKMSKDFELISLRSIGLSFWQIIRGPIVLSLGITFCCYFVYDRLTPLATNSMYKIFNSKRAGYFVHTIKDKDGSLNRVVIISEFDDRNKLDDISVLDFSKNRYENLSVLSCITLSDWGKKESNRWVLYNNKQYVLSPVGIFEKVKILPTFEIYTKDNQADSIHKLMLYSLKKQKELTNAQMRQYISLLRKEGFKDDYNYMLNKYIQRYSHSFICVLFTIFGCLLGFAKPREQRLLGFTIAIGVVFAYYITLPFFDMLAEKSIVSPYITSTIQPILMIIVIYFLKIEKGL